MKRDKIESLLKKEAIVFLCCFYPGLLLGQVLWMNTQMSRIVSGNSSPSIEFGLNAFKFLFSGPYGVIGIIGLFALVNAAYHYLTHKKTDGQFDEDRNLTYSDKGTYGTSGWIRDKELAQVIHITLPETTDEIILGRDEASQKVFTVPNDSQLNKHIAVYGASGTGKSRAFARTYILQAMRRSARIVIKMIDGVQATRQQTLEIKRVLRDAGVQAGDRGDGSYVVPYHEKDKIIDAKGNLLDILQQMECQFEVEIGESMLITDPKGELYETMSEFLLENGYDVKILNIKDANGMQHSDSWNCLAEIEGDDLNAQIFADTIIRNTAGKENGDFWSACEMNLLKALCLYVERNPDIPTQMGEVYNLITKRKPEELDRMFEELPFNEDTQAAKAAYSIYQQANDNVKGGVIIGLGSRLQVFQGQAVRDITNHNEISLRAPGKRKCAYFCITSDQQGAFDFLAALFYSLLFVKLVAFADSHGLVHGGNRECWVPVNFVLDEFPNIAQIADFTKKISTVRSRSINIAVIFQNLAQLQNRYPYGQWEEILGNCDTNLFLGCTDATTAKYISDRTGVVTVGVSSQSKDQHIGAIFNPLNYKESSSIGKRNLLTPDEVLRLPRSDELILLRGQKPLRCQKFDYSLHPNSNKLKKCSIADHIPKWKAEKLIPPAYRAPDPAGNAIPGYYSGKWTAKPSATPAVPSAKAPATPVAPSFATPPNYPQKGISSVTEPPELTAKQPLNMNLPEDANDKFSNEFVRPKSYPKK